MNTRDLTKSLFLTTFTLASCSGLGTTVVSGPTITWGQKQVIAQGKQYSPPSVSVNESGQATLAWIEKGKESERGEVRLLTLTGGQSAQPVLVSPPDSAPDATHSAPGLALGPAREVYLTWSIPKPAPDGVSATDLLLARSLDGGSAFDPPIVVNDDGGLASHGFEGVSVGRDGAIYLTWLDGRDKAKDKSGSGTFFARSTDQGKTVSRNVKVDGMSCPCCRTTSIETPDGAILASWRKVFEGGARDVVVARSTDGGESFSPPSLVRQDKWVFPACPHRGPSLGVDRKGRVYAAWYTEGTDEQARIYFAVSDDGGLTFSEPVSLHTSTTSLPDQPKMAVHPDGVVIVVWEEVTGVRKRVVMRASNDRGATFPDVQVVSEGTKGANPAVSISRSGAVAVAWTDRVFPNDQIVVKTGTINVPSAGRARR
jgi:hypothetical protein